MTLKTPIVLLFVALYGVALIRPAFPLIEYYFQLDAYLAACANRDRPELHCNGQCVLMQKLKASQDGDDAPVPPPPAKVDLQEYPIGFVGATDELVVSDSADEKTPRLVTPYSPEFAQEIFHPPA